MIYKTVLVQLILLLFYITANSQTYKGVCSKDNSYFISAELGIKLNDSVTLGTDKVAKRWMPKKYWNIFKLFDVDSLKLEKTFYYKSQNKDKVKSFGFTYNNKSVYMHSSKWFMLWNILSGENICQIQGAKSIAIGNTQNTFALITKRTIILGNTENGKLTDSVVLPDYPSEPELFLSPLDEYLVMKTFDRKLFLFQTQPLKLLNTYNADDLRFFQNDSSFVLFINERKKTETRFIKLPLLTELYRVDGLYLADLKKKFDDRNLKWRLWIEQEEKNRQRNIPIKIENDKCVLSPDGKTVVFYTSYASKNAALIIASTTNRDKISILNKSNFQGNIEMFPYYWITDSLMTITANPLQSILINTNSGNIIQDMHFYFNFDETEREIPWDMQAAKIIISPNYKYVALPVKYGIYTRSSLVVHEKNFIPDVSFLCFSADSKIMFVRNKQGFVAAVKTMDISAPLTTELKTYYLYDSIMMPRRERPILFEADPPPGYTYLRMKDLRDISTMNDTTSIKMYLKTIGVKDKETHIQLHLFDKEGNYFFGGGKPEWRNIWCTVKLISPDGTEQQITDFKVTEYSEKDSMPSAMAIVLDHSGSMGDPRAYILQEAAMSFIGKKRPNDVMAVVKYDEKIDMEVPFTTNKNDLIKKLTLNGLQGFGGATALLDAIDKTARELNDLKAYKRKSILILTDGNENASNLPANYVIKNLMRNTINVYTIGFGEYVSEEYLQSISYLTEGSYYQIYKSKDFDWIFSDVERKMRNYYDISFTTKSFGEYVAIIEICYQNQKKDSLITGLDNTPIILDSIPDDGNDLYNSKLKPRIVPVEKIFEPSEKAKEEFANLIFPDIKFDTDETAIIPGTDEGLDKVIDFLKKYKNVSLQIDGHTDNEGTEEHNKLLSEGRAEAVKNLLVKKGISAKRIFTAGYGATKPLTDNDSETGKAKNRRVEFSIYKPFKQK